MKINYRKLPIKFARREDGSYASACGRYIITKTEHRGKNTTHSGTTRWWIRDVIRDAPVIRANSWHPGYAITLELAIEELHTQIARGIANGFEHLYRHDRRVADEAHISAVRMMRAEAVAALVQEHGAGWITTREGAEAIAAVYARPVVVRS